MNLDLYINAENFFQPLLGFVFLFIPCPAIVAIVVFDCVVCEGKQI